MIEIGNAGSLRIVGFILFGSGLFLLFLAAHKLGLRERALTLLLLMTMVGLVLLAISYFEIIRADYIGRPLMITELKENWEYEVIAFSPDHSKVAPRQGNKADVRYIIGLPQMSNGSKFLIRDKKVIRLYPGPKLVPQVAF